MPTLYATDAPRRFFLIPDDAKLPAGRLTLRSLTGEALAVDEDVAVAFEVPEDEAKEHARVQVDAVARQARAVLSGAGRVLREVARAQREGDKIRRAPRAAEGNVADALGISTEQLRDPAAVKAGLQQVLDGLKATLEDLAKKPGDDAGRAEWLRALDEAVVAAGGEPLGEDVSAWPERLRGFLADPQRVSELRAATEALREAARR